MSYNSSFQIVKTSKNIEKIKTKVSDRLIITKSGEMYFDYSEDERIAISPQVTTYKYTSLFSGNPGYYQTILYNDLKLYDKTNNKYNVTKAIKNSFVFDNNGSYGIIVAVGETYCSVVILAIINPDILSDLDLGDSLVKNIIIAKEVDDIKITKSILNPETNTSNDENINIKSKDKVIKLDVETPDESTTNIQMSINLSKMNGNILQILEDGLFVSETGNVEKYVHYDPNYKSYLNIPQPYLESNLYLISPSENQYELYVSISKTQLIQIGNSGLEIYRI